MIQLNQRSCKIFFFSGKSPVIICCDNVLRFPPKNIHKQSAVAAGVFSHGVSSRSSLAVCSNPTSFPPNKAIIANMPDSQSVLEAELD